MQGDEIDEFLDELHGEEVAGTVEVHAAIGKARLVLDIDGGQAHSLRLLGDNRQRFAQRLDAQEHTCRRLARDGHALRGHADFVAFVVQNLRVEREQDVAARHLRDLCLLVHRLAGQLQLCHLTDVVGEEMGVSFHVGIAFRIDDGRLFAQHESRCSGHDDRLGHWHHVVISHLSQCGSCR